MRYIALATDYDGTIASKGRVPQSTIEALERLRASGRRVLLVTGRELPDLKTVFDRLDLFDRVVAENGALLYRPARHDQQALAEHAPEQFLQLLRDRNVPFSVGCGIVATVEPHQQAVLDAIRELGIEWHVIFNKGAVMALPSGVNKATGLRCALEELGISEHNVAAIGDAENDHALLALCEFGVAVENAVPSLKERADLVTKGARGEGVEQLVELLLNDDLESYDHRQRHKILVGHRVKNVVAPEDRQGDPVYVAASRGSVLFSGPSGSGKSTAASGVIERFGEAGYQFCLIDPEGDYEGFPKALVLGTSTNAPNASEVLQALEKPSQNVVVNLIGIPLSDRPMYFAGLMPLLLEMRTRSARPHWIIVDETHHLLPSAWVPAPVTVPRALGGLIMITVHPDWVAKPALQEVQTIVAVGKEAQNTFDNFARTVDVQAPRLEHSDLPGGIAAIWTRNGKDDVAIVRAEPAKFERKRHTRKYAEGELPPDRSFYFRGAEGKLNLRAQNLNMFLQLADGVDDETWRYHLQRGEYSDWFRRCIKDPSLAQEVEEMEKEASDQASNTRERVKQAIQQRYAA
ncbi:MAG TPA: HAD family hydrolase [Clostridia bacterium]|nr:HAD family hydrolase [Clostridia bacterium]